MKVGAVTRQAMRIEALAFIACARLLLAALPFRRLKSLLSPPLGVEPAAGREAEAAIASVHAAILWAWKRGWLRDTCFHRAIAAHFMLRRRRVATQFHYGAATLSTRGLTGHVWLTSAHGPVVGGNQAADYPQLLSWGDDPTKTQLAAVLSRSRL